MASQRNLLRIVAPAFVAGAECYRHPNGAIAWGKAAPVLRSIVRKENITVDEFVRGLAKRKWWQHEWLPGGS